MLKSEDRSTLNKQTTFDGRRNNKKNLSVAGDEI